METGGEPNFAFLREKGATISDFINLSPVEKAVT
jgi:hypothetical protein